MISYIAIQGLRKRAADYHVVQPNNTLYGIFKQYNVPVADLLKFNPGINPNNLQIGTRINLKAPGGQPAQPQPAKPAWKVSRQPFQYTVVTGDSPARIAKQYGVRLNRFMQANPGMSALRPGMKVNVPLSDIDWFGQKHGFDYHEFTPLTTADRDAIAMVESSGGKNLVKRYQPSGRLLSLGHYQIEEPTFNHAVSQNPDLAKYKFGPDLYDRGVSDKVMDEFYKFHVPQLQWKLGRRLTRDELVALWNQGPGGYTNQKAKDYVAKFKSFLNPKQGV